MNKVQQKIIPFASTYNSISYNHLIVTKIQCLQNKSIFSCIFAHTHFGIKHLYLLWNKKSVWNKKSEG